MSMRWALPLFVALAMAVAACGGGDNKPSSSAQPNSEVSGSPVGVGSLAHAVVQIQALDSRDQAVWTGSGTFISADGVILTNGHVVDDRNNEYKRLGVGITNAADEPPDLKYVAEIQAVDYALDLAVIKVTTDLNGQKVTEQFPFIQVGDSQTVDIGDEVRILGYPGIGGDTITFTNGVVSGFTADRAVGGRAWIKTDATIAGGNSGGLAVDKNNKLIGVPTVVGSGSGGDTVDCRVLSDTNRDGQIDSGDSCVPVGGFINGLRPVNLATPLVDAVHNGTTYVSKIQPEPKPSAGFDASGVTLSNFAFADGVTADDAPTNIVTTLPTATARACGFWDFAGMQDGMSWEASWFVNGTLDQDASIVNDTWVGGQSGNWWVCAVDERGLPDGLYELIVSVEGEARGSSAIFAGGDHPTASVTLKNGLTTPVCYVFLSPTGAQNWGFDVLPLDSNGIDGGSSFTLDVPAGTYDLLAEDCDANSLFEEHELDVTEDTVVLIE